MMVIAIMIINSEKGGLAGVLVPTSITRNVTSKISLSAIIKIAQRAHNSPCRKGNHNKNKSAMLVVKKPAPADCMKFRDMIWIPLGRFSQLLPIATR